MVIHDYLTTISCDKCSREFQIERNLKENTIRRMAKKQGWCVVDGEDICPKCAAEINAEADEKRMIPVYLGNCDAEDCKHFRWCGDSYWDRNTECYCLLSGKSVYRIEANEKQVVCPLGKMMDEEERNVY